MKTIALSVLGIVFIYGCSMFQEKLTESDFELQKEAKEYFKPIGTSVIDEKKYAARIELGRELYFEKAMSKSGTISCNSCHQLDNFGVDNEPTSPGHDGTRGDRNSPSSYNAALHLAQFWDGRAKDLAAQAIGPILNPIEHGMASEKQVMKVLKDKGYESKFKKAFPKYKWPFTYKNVGKAIAAFEKTLLTPSRFDDYLKGDVRALSSSERRGLKKFIENGCIGCHEGQGIGGHQYQKLGAVNPYDDHDKGRFNVTKDEDDKQVFKVPSLRNVTHTYPYFHNGKVKDLEEAIRLMGWHQLGIKLTDEDIDDIADFLGSLEAKDEHLFKM